MSFHEKWMAALTKPKETFAAEKANASITEGMKNMAIAGAIYGLIASLITFSTGGIGGVFGGIIGMAIGAVIGSIIGAGIPFLIAKLLGGNGTISQQYYLITLFAAPLMIVSPILSIIPVAGGLISLLILVIDLYLLTLVLKEVHGFSTMKAVAVWLIPLVIIGIIAAVLFAALFAALFKFGAAAAAAATATP